LYQNWTKTFDEAVALVRALQFDFSFDVQFSFGWPELPHFGEIHCVLALGVLIFQLFVKNFVRRYYNTGAITFGTAVLQKALVESRRSEETNQDLESSKEDNFVNNVYMILSSALFTAVKMETIMSKLTVKRRLKTTYKKNKIERIKADSRLPEEFDVSKALKNDAQLLIEKIAVLEAKVEDLQSEIGVNTRSLLLVKEKLTKAPKTTLGLDRELFLKLLEFNSATGRSDFSSCTDISLSSVDAAEVRESISKFLLNKRKEEVGTSELIEVLFRQKVPDIKCLGMYRVDCVNGCALSALLREKNAIMNLWSIPKRKSVPTTRKANSLTLTFMNWTTKSKT